MRLNQLAWPTVILLAVLVSACSNKEPASDTPKPAVLATVNGESITEADVDFMLERMLNGQALIQVNEELRQKVLDSLIASHAMKIQAKAAMTPDELEQLARTVKNYEEELYVKAYLSKNVTPEPVSVEMVQAYYDSHSNEFGSESVKDFQLLVLRDAKDEKKRDQLLAAVAAIKSTADWRAKAKELQQKYYLQYQEGRNKAGLLDKGLEQAMGSLKQGETSGLVYVDDQIYLVRVTSVTQTAAKPLAEVSADIRRKLAAQQLRSAVKKASETVLTKVQVTRADANKIDAK